MSNIAMGGDGSKEAEEAKSDNAAGGDGSMGAEGAQIDDAAAADRRKKDAERQRRCRVKAVKTSGQQGALTLFFSNNKARPSLDLGVPLSKAKQLALLSFKTQERKKE